MECKDYLFFPEVNENATIKNAKRKLREYKRWERIAADNAEEHITQVYTLEPRGTAQTNTSKVEKLAINRVAAQQEQDSIKLAVNNIADVVYRKILIDKYILRYNKSDVEIYMSLGYEKTRYYIMLRQALLAFAESYKHGVLIITEGVDNA